MESKSGTDNLKKKIEEIIKNYSGEVIKDHTEEKKGISWEGFKDFFVSDKVVENEEITSFYLVSKDGSKLPIHEAGQSIIIKPKNPDDKYKNVARSYSLSMKPGEDFYRISVKRVEGGLMSNYLHNDVNPGDTVEIMKPRGTFVLKENKKDVPLVLIAGGIGITPLMSMLYEAADKRSHIDLVECVRNSKLKTFGSEIAELKKENSGIKEIIVVGEALDGEVEGKDYDFKGHISEEWIKNNLPLNGEFYFCGPPVFMKVLYKALLDLGVSEEDINFEFFGPKEDLLK